MSNPGKADAFKTCYIGPDRRLLASNGISGRARCVLISLDCNYGDHKCQRNIRGRQNGVDRYMQSVHHFWRIFFLHVCVVASCYLLRCSAYVCDHSCCRLCASVSNTVLSA